MDIKIYSHNEKKDLVKKIEKLTSKNHYKQVFKILKSSGIKITQNSNGVFFNMNDLTNELLKKLDDYLDSVLNKINASIDMKYYNNVIMNTTTQSEGTMNKNIIDYNNDSNINDILDEKDDEDEEDDEDVKDKNDEAKKEEAKKEEVKKDEVKKEEAKKEEAKKEENKKEENKKEENKKVSKKK